MKHSISTITPADETRKRRFLVALRVAGTTMEAWALKERLTQSHVSNVLAGRRSNPEIARKIDAFIKKHLKHLRHVA